MPLLALLASDSEMVPVGAIELWWVKRAPNLGELLHQFRRHRGHALHVAAVARVQHAARDDVADLPAVGAPSPGACAASRR
jgi:hypothetical protein